MVSLFDLTYDLIWLAWGAMLPRNPDAQQALQDYRRFMFVFTQLLMYASHLTLSAHLYAWVVRRSSPAKLSQRFLPRITAVVVIILAIALSIGYAVPTQQHKITGRCSVDSIGACYGYFMMVLAPGSVRGDGRGVCMMLRVVVDTTRRSETCVGTHADRSERPPIRIPTTHAHTRTTHKRTIRWASSSTFTSRPTGPSTTWFTGTSRQLDRTRAWPPSPRASATAYSPIRSCSPSIGV
jgi:hypothetical protein